MYFRQTESDPKKKMQFQPQESSNIFFHILQCDIKSYTRDPIFKYVSDNPTISIMDYYFFGFVIGLLLCLYKYNSILLFSLFFQLYIVAQQNGGSNDDVDPAQIGKIQFDTLSK